jgi:hypothetical protein
MLTSLVTGNTCYEFKELAMLQSFKVDQAATFASVILLSVEPKLGFKSTEQERTSDGVPKWECQVVAGFRQFGRVVNEVIKSSAPPQRPATSARSTTLRVLDELATPGR